MSAKQDDNERAGTAIDWRMQFVNWGGNNAAVAAAAVGNIWHMPVYRFYMKGESSGFEDLF